MKRFLFAVALCTGLLFAGMFSLLPQGARAKENILLQFLNLPAPPPPNPLFRVSINSRDEKFYSKKNPPKDDAPIEDLLAYWKHQSETYQELGFNIKPSDKTLDRLRSEIEKKPETVVNFLNVLPDNPETAALVRRIYDSSGNNTEIEDWEKTRLKRWLSLNSDQFSDELLESAQETKDVGEYVGNQEELLALARVDWEKASPVVARLYNSSNQRVAPVLARWALYRRALDTDSFGDIDRYRSELKAIVEDKSATAGMRDLAFDALVKEKDWNGRDDWYFTLLEDETLADLRVNGTSYTGLTTLVLYSDPDKYADKMLELLGSSNQTVRNAAIRNLGRIIDKDHPEVVKALLPWLENSKWATEISGERRRLVDALQNLKITESVQGLINVLDEKQTQEVYTYPGVGSMSNIERNAAKMAANAANMAANSVGSSDTNPGVKTQVEYYPYRYSAISALATQKDVRAVNPLRRVLPEVQEYERHAIVKAILVSGGFSIPEQLEAIELHAQGVKEEIKQEAEAEKLLETVKEDITDTPVSPPRVLSVRTVTGSAYAMNTNAVRKPFNPAEIKPILGAQIASNTEPEAEFLQALVERINILEKRDTQLAQALRRIMQGWSGTAVNALLLNDLKNNKLEVDAIVKLLSIRKGLRENQSSDIFNIRGGNATALGISACLLEDNNEYDAILAGNNSEAKTAMLGCARLIRAALPIRKVAENLNSADKMLALAAERYLESEDSPEARQIVLSLHPNEAKILGATTFFGNDNSTSISNLFIKDLFESVGATTISGSYYYLVLAPSENAEIETTEKKLQKEVLGNQELLGVYAYDDNFIRIYKDRAVFSWEEDAARYRERVLEKDEFDNFKAFLASQKVDELVPFLGSCEECGSKELLMLGRGGGRRVYVRAEPLPEFFAELEKIFEDMRRPPAKLRYHLEKNIAGLEILFADDNLEAVTLWKNGSDFRLLISNPERREEIEDELTKLARTSEVNEINYEQREKMFRQRRQQTLSQHLAWYKFADGKAVEQSGQPPLIETPPISDGTAIESTEEQWKARAGNIEIRADQEGLYKKTGGQNTKIREGYYTKPVITPNGRWAISNKYDEDRKLVRVNLQNGKEFEIVSEQMPTCEAKASIAALNKILVVCGYFQGYYQEEETGEEPRVVGENYLLDAETGAMQKAKGELRPLSQQTFRPLQTNGKADEFWAAIPDKGKNETFFGTYNAKTLTFKETLKLPQIEVDSMDVWADADDGKLYIVYQGHLLSVPLKK